MCVIGRGGCQRQERVGEKEVPANPLVAMLDLGLIPGHGSLMGVKSEGAVLFGKHLLPEYHHTQPAFFLRIRFLAHLDQGFGRDFFSERRKSFPDYFSFPKKNAMVKICPL